MIIVLSERRVQHCTIKKVSSLTKRFLFWPSCFISTKWSSRWTSCLLLAQVVFFWPDKNKVCFFLSFSTNYFGLKWPASASAHSQSSLNYKTDKTEKRTDKTEKNDKTDLQRIGNRPGTAMNHNHRAFWWHIWKFTFPDNILLMTFDSWWHTYIYIYKWSCPFLTSHFLVLSISEKIPTEIIIENTVDIQSEQVCFKLVLFEGYKVYAGAHLFVLICGRVYSF